MAACGGGDLLHLLAGVVGDLLEDNLVHLAAAGAFGFDKLAVENGELRIEFLNLGVGGRGFQIGERERDFLQKLLLAVVRGVDDVAGVLLAVIEDGEAAV